MVHLDTHFIIYASAPGTPQDRRLRDWLAAGVPVGISAPARAEFLWGPLDPTRSGLAQALFSNPEPFTAADAVRDADLFNATGRRRGSLVDCRIAATAIRVGASLATENLDDLRRFEPMGLRLARP